MEQFIRKCEWCEIEFTTEWETKAYCSRTHKERASQHRKRGRRTQGTKTLHIRLCKGCATQFSTDRADKMYCSEDCREWTRRQLREHRDKEWEKAKTKKLKERLYWRDKGLCQICLEPMDTSVKYPDPMSFSIDHLIPRSQGGKHDFDNLRIAHLACNYQRGDKPA